MSLTYFSVSSVLIGNRRIAICQSSLRFNEIQTLLQTWPQSETCLTVVLETKTEHRPHLNRAEDKLSAIKWGYQTVPDYDLVRFAVLTGPYMSECLCVVFAVCLTLYQQSVTVKYLCFTSLGCGFSKISWIWLSLSGDIKTTPDQPQILVSQPHISFIWQIICMQVLKRQTGSEM